MGEHVRIGDYLATVTKTDGRRVEQVNFKRLPPEERADADAAAAREDDRLPAAATPRGRAG